MVRFTLKLLPLLLCLLAILPVAPVVAQQGEGISGAGTATGTSVAPDPVFADLEEILSTLATITGLEKKHDVPYQRLDKEGLRKFMEQRWREEVDPAEVMLEEKVLKKFGLLPKNYDLRASTLDLLTEQAVAFYDYKKKKLYLIEDHGEGMMRLALVHELAHALADQHFNIEKFLDDVKDQDDAALARLSVMEGQASWLMSEYVAHQAGQSLLQSDAVFSVLTQVSESEASNFPTFRESPLYLRVTLLFPYTKGMIFQQEVVKKLGKDAFRKVFEHPPASTREILTPSAYLANSEFEAPPLAKVAGKGYEQKAEGDLGQVDLSVLLAMAMPRKEAEALAEGWRGGSFAYFEASRKQPSQLLTATRWADPETADKVFRAWPQILDSKWDKFQITPDSGTRMGGKGDDGYFCIELDGDVVRTKEGLTSPCR